MGRVAVESVEGTVAAGSSQVAGSKMIASIYVNKELISTQNFVMVQPATYQDARIKVNQIPNYKTSRLKTGDFVVPKLILEYLSMKSGITKLSD